MRKKRGRRNGDATRPVAAPARRDQPRRALRRRPSAASSARRARKRNQTAPPNQPAILERSCRRSASRDSFRAKAVSCSGVTRPPPARTKAVSARPQNTAPTSPCILPLEEPSGPCRHDRAWSCDSLTENSGRASTPVGDGDGVPASPIQPKWPRPAQTSSSDQSADQPLLESRRIGLGPEGVVIVLGVKPPFPGPLLEPDEIARPRLWSPVRQAHGDDPVPGPGVLDRRKSFHARGRWRFAPRVEPQRRVLNSRDQTHTGSSENTRTPALAARGPSPRRQLNPMERRRRCKRRR